MGSSSRWRPLVDADPERTVEQGTPLTGVAKWAAAGFTLLTGLLTFLGITQGPLDRILGAHPQAGLMVFVLVGLAVGLAVVAPALPATPQVKAGWLVGIGIVLTLWVYVRVPDLDDLQRRLEGGAQPQEIIAFVVAAGAFIAAVQLLGRVSVPLNAGALAVALAALSLGLYASVKLAVISKSPSDLGAISTQVTGSDRGDHLVVTVSLAQTPPEDYVLLEVTEADGAAPGEWTQQRRLIPDATGVVNEEVPLLLPIPSPSHVEVTLARCSPEAVGPKCEDPRASALVRVVADVTPRLGLAVAPDDEGRLLTTVTGEGFRAGDLVRLCVNADDADVLSAQLTARRDGTVGGTYILPDFDPGTLVTATSVGGQPDGQCTGDAPPRAAATYRVREPAPAPSPSPTT